MLTKEQLATELGVTPSQIERYRARGMPCTRARNPESGQYRYVYDLAECAEWRLKNIDSPNSEQSESSLEAEKKKAEVVLLKAKAELAIINRDKARDAVAQVSDVITVIRNVFAIVRSAVLLIPQHVVNELAYKYAIPEDKHMAFREDVYKICVKALESLSSESFDRKKLLRNIEALHKQENI